MNDGEDSRSEDADDAKPAHEAGEQEVFQFTVGTSF